MLSSTRTIYALDMHAEGEPVRVVLGGLPPLPGKTLAEKVESFRGQHDDVRALLLMPPRGNRDYLGAAVTEPGDPRADFGVIFMDTFGYLSMCGDAVIATTTAIVEAGMVREEAGEAKITLDTPAGLVRVTATVEAGRAKKVRFVNVPAFVYAEGLALDVEGIGSVPVDIAFGGNFFALVPAEAVGVPIIPERAGRLVALGEAVKVAANRQFAVKHPENPRIASIELVMFYERPGRDHIRNAVIFGKRQLTLSPCGTGTSAMLSLLMKRGELSLADRLESESILNTFYYARPVGTSKVGDFDAVSPEIEGAAYPTGDYRMIVDPDDPLKNGYLVG